MPPLVWISLQRGERKVGHTLRFTPLEAAQLASCDPSRWWAEDLLRGVIRIL